MTKINQAIVIALLMFIVANTIGNVYARIAISGIGFIYLVVASYFLGYSGGRKKMK